LVLSVLRSSPHSITIDRCAQPLDVNWLHAHYYTHFVPFMSFQAPASILPAYSGPVIHTAISEVIDPAIIGLQSCIDILLDVLQTRAALALLLYPRDVLLRHCVPCAHVFLHAVCEALLFARRERGAGFRDAALEAVLVQLFDEEARILHGGFLLDLAHDLHLAAKCVSIRSW
jgi:hypothetical protein